MREDLYILVDIETNGLADNAAVLEIATLVTGPDFVPIDPGFSVVVRHIRPIMMETDFVTAMHTENGLIAAMVAGKGMWPRDADDALLSYVKWLAEPGKIPMTGSTIGFDRKHLRRAFPHFESFFHYRSIDISSVKELWKRWFPQAGQPPKPEKKAHRALADCYASLDELRWYHEHMRAVTDVH